MDDLHRRAILKLPLPDAQSLASGDETDNVSLLQFTDARCPPVTAVVAARQKLALEALHALFTKWAQQPFHMFISGSYRIGVHSDDADIDVLFVTTAAVSRAAVFTGFLAALTAHENATDVQPIPHARVPVIGAKLHGQEFDILTCHLRVDTLPSRDELLTSYEWMNGLEDACILGFNGPRLTELILRSVPRPTQFCASLRFLRYWAKSRLVYSNKAGFLGGVNFALMLMYVAQRHPKANAALLVTHFFTTFAAWKWSRARPRPVRLDEHVLHECPVWLQAFEWVPRAAECMVVLTPCFPRFNTTFTTSPLTLSIMQKEFQRAVDTGAQFEHLCQSVEALTTCPRFIRIAIQAPGTLEGRAWQGYVEAQVRYLVEYMSREELAIAEFRYVPMWAVTANAVTGTCTKSTYVTAADDGRIRTYLVRGTLEQPLQYFIKEHASKGPPRPTFSCITAQFCERDALPPEFAGTAPMAAKGSVTSTAVQAVQVSTAGRVFDPPRPWRLRLQPPRAQMKWVLRPDVDKPRSPVVEIIRPLMRNGRLVRQYDVYIGPACTWARTRLNGSSFAPPVGMALEAYAEYARARFQTDKTWARAVLQLRGKVLACWCPVPSSGCHGHALRALIEDHAH